MLSTPADAPRRVESAFLTSAMSGAARSLAGGGAAARKAKSENYKLSACLILDVHHPASSQSAASGVTRRGGLQGVGRRGTGLAHPAPSARASLLAPASLHACLSCAFCRSAMADGDSFMERARARAAAAGAALKGAALRAKDAAAPAASKAATAVKTGLSEAKTKVRLRVQVFACPRRAPCSAPLRILTPVSSRVYQHAARAACAWRCAALEAVRELMMS